MFTVTRLHVRDETKGQRQLHLVYAGQICYTPASVLSSSKEMERADGEGPREAKVLSATSDQSGEDCLLAAVAHLSWAFHHHARPCSALGTPVCLFVSLLVTFWCTSL